MPGQEEPPICGRVPGRLDGARGWNADQFGRCPVTAPLVLHPVGAWNAGSVPGLVVGTLLGPEGAGPVARGTGVRGLSRGRAVPCSTSPAVGRVGWGRLGWWLFVG